MTTTYIGSRTIGGALPAALEASLAGEAGINAALPDIRARLEALRNFRPVPLSFSVQLATAQALVASIQAAIALALPVPSLDAQIAQVLALVADLLAAITAIEAHLAVVGAFRAQLGAAGVHVLAYEGDVASMAADVGSVLSTVPGLAPTDDAHALVLVTTVPATWAALAAIAGVAP